MTDYKKDLQKVFVDYLEYCSDCHNWHESKEEVLDCFIDSVRENILPHIKRDNENETWDFNPKEEKNEGKITDATTTPT